METRFFDYSQNNSGGSFQEDAEAGITNHVIIEAYDASEADDKAEQIGIYFDGIDKGLDCGCCGDRWCTTYGEGDEIPMIYGTPLVEGQPYKSFLDWTEVLVYIHYANGVIAAVVNDNGILRFKPNA